MTVQELRARLKSMNASERAKFIGAVGMPGYSDEMVIDHFVKEAAWEKKICDVLNEPTEADRVGQANIASARYARLGYVIGLIAIGIAVISLIVSIIAIVK